MKNLILIIFAICVNSCKKDFTCECSSSGGGSTTTTIVNIHETKKSARQACAQYESTSNCGTTTPASCS